MPGLRAVNIRKKAVSRVTGQCAIFIKCRERDVAAAAILKSHYTALGFDRVIFAPFGRWPDRALARLRATAGEGSVCAAESGSSWKEIADLETALAGFSQESWLACGDASECLTVPFGNTRKCMAALERMGINRLRAAFPGVQAQAERIVMFRRHGEPPATYFDAIETGSDFLRRGRSGPLLRPCRT